MDEMNEQSRRSNSAENARIEAAQIQKNTPQYSEREKILQEVIQRTDFLEVGKDGSPDEADALEQKAFAMIESVPADAPQRSEIKNLFMRAYAIRLRLKFEERQVEGATRQHSLRVLLDSSWRWMQGAGNIPELKSALADLEDGISFRVQFGEQMDFVLGAVQRVAEGEGSVDDQNFVARFYRAVQGIYSGGQTKEKRETIINHARLGDFSKLDFSKVIRRIARSYRTMARRKVREGELDPYSETAGAFGINV